MSTKRKLVIAALVTLVSALGLFLYRAYSAADYFIFAERNQNTSVVKSLETMDSRKIIVLYKRHCKVCKAWDEEVTSTLEPYDASYLDIEDGIPENVSTVLSTLHQDVHTPLVLVVSRVGGNYLVQYSRTVDSKDSLEDLKNYLRSNFTS